jgi:hypothetical protein
VEGPLSADRVAKRPIGQNGCPEHIDPSHQVVRRDHLVEAKLVQPIGTGQ